MVEDTIDQVNDRVQASTPQMRDIPRSVYFEGYSEFFRQNPMDPGPMNCWLQRAAGIFPGIPSDLIYDGEPGMGCCPAAAIRDEGRLVFRCPDSRKRHCNSRRLVPAGILYPGCPAETGFMHLTVISIRPPGLYRPRVHGATPAPTQIPGYESPRDTGAYTGR